MLGVVQGSVIDVNVPEIGSCAGPEKDFVSVWHN